MPQREPLSQNSEFTIFLQNFIINIYHITRISEISVHWLLRNHLDMTCEQIRASRRTITMRESSDPNILAISTSTLDSESSHEVLFKSGQ